MHKRARTRIANITMDELPVEIIHHILSFLSPKEVAQISVLSKTLFLAWSTYPDFDFCQYTLCRNPSNSKLVKEKLAMVVDVNLLRYSKHNLPINKFCLDFTFSDLEWDSLLHNWLGTISDLGVKHLILKIDQIPTVPSFFVLSPLIFASEQLTSLSVLQSFSDAPTPISFFCPGSIRCCNLKTLSLQSVCFDDCKFQKICSSCPLIEHITLEECIGLNNIQVSNLDKLVFFKLTNTPDFDEETEDLKQVHISSRILKSLIFCQCVSQEDVKIDAPNLLYLTYTANRIPSFSSEFSLSEQFNSELHIEPNYALDNSFLVKFKHLVSKLSHCDSYLDITEYSSRRIFFNIQQLREIRPPKIRKVRLSLSTRSSTYSTLVHGLLWSCLPETLEVWFPIRNRYEFVKFLCKELIADRTCSNCCHDQLGCWHHYLKEVQVEYCSNMFYDQWNPFDWKSLVDESMAPKDCSSIRFTLNW